MPKNKRTKEEDAVKWFNSLDTPNEITITKEYAERWEKERTAREKAKGEKPSMSTKKGPAWDTQDPADKMRAMMGTKKGREKVAKANEMFSMMPIKKNQNTSGKSENTGTTRSSSEFNLKSNLENYSAAENIVKTGAEAAQEKDRKTEAAEAAKRDAEFEKVWEKRNGGRRRTRKHRRRKATRKPMRRKTKRRTKRRRKRTKKSGRKSRRRTRKRV